MRLTYDYFKSLSEDELKKNEHKDFSSHNRK
jgi:dTDP-glucose 4,6-dehydratase